MSAAGEEVRLLRFLVRAVAPRPVVAIAPEAGIAAFLVELAAREHVRLTVLADDAAETADEGAADGIAGRQPPGGGLLYLGPGVRLPDAPIDVLIVGTDEAAVPPGEDRVVAWVPLAPAVGSPRLLLGMAGGSPSPAAEAALVAIAEGNRRQAPTDPIDPLAGRVLYLLARFHRARRVLELGTSTGAAAVWLASALPRKGGRVDSVERDSARRTLAGKHLARAGLAERVELVLGDAERVIPRLSGPFDLVFLDEDPAERADHLTALLPVCAPGALVVSRGGIGNALALAPFNALLRTHPAIADVASLAVGDGLTMARVE